MLVDRIYPYMSDVLASVLDGCRYEADGRCYVVRAEFFEILSWIACAWGVAMVALLLGTRHVHRWWIAAGVVLALFPITWLLTVDTPHTEINAFGAFVGWMWGIGAAAALWVAAHPDRIKFGEPSLAWVRGLALGALAIATLAPLATPLIEPFAHTRAERRLPPLPTDEFGTRPTPAPAIPRPSK